MKLRNLERIPDVFRVIARRPSGRRSNLSFGIASAAFGGLAMTVFAMGLFLVFVPTAFSEEAAPEEGEAVEEAAAEEAPAEEAAPDEAGYAADEESISVDEPLTPLETEPADDQQIQPSAAGIYEKVSLDLRNIEVTEALRFLAQKGGLNIAVSKSVTGRVQLVLNDVPIGDVLDIIFITAGLAYEKKGDIYYIMTEAEYKERYGRKFTDTRRVKVFRLKYAVPDQAFALFEMLKSEIGRILVDTESGTVLVMDTDENIDRMEKALVGLEQKRNIKVYSLKYAKAIDVESRLKTQLDLKKVGAVTADERTNQLIIETFPDRMKEIDDLILSLDQKTREVLIDATIIKVNLDDTFTSSIKWEGFFKQFMAYGFTYLGSHPFSPIFRLGQSAVDDFVRIAPTTLPTTIPKVEATENLVIGSSGATHSYEALINFLNTLGETQILSNPKIAVVNNQEAKIHVGEKQAYVTTTTTTGQTTTTTAEAVTFVDVGIQLAVTPTINEDGYVSMKIKPEISSVVSFLTTPSGNKIPIIDSAVAETSVMVKDGVTIIIGGLRREEKTDVRKKVPFFGDIPIIGMGFNSSTATTRHVEILVLITPHIMYGDTLVVGQKEKVTTEMIPYSDYKALGTLHR